MEEGQDAEFLHTCLKYGGNSSTWNDYKKSRTINEVAFESIPRPLTEAYAKGVKLHLNPCNLWLADLEGADLEGYDLSGANLSGANLRNANLKHTDLSNSQLIVANLNEADLQGADLSRANLLDAKLRGANLIQCDLTGTLLLRTDVEDSIFERCNIHGSSAWGLSGTPKRQSELTITTIQEPTVTVDDIEVGQFIYLMLKNEKIRNILDTITSKTVLILGNFSRERKEILDALRDTLRTKNLSPIIFDFEPSSNLDFVDTVTLLARMSRFVLADLTTPKSVPHELASIAPEIMVAIQPIILKGQEPWALFPDLQRRSRGLLPIYEYCSLDNLIKNLDEKVIIPAEDRRHKLTQIGA